VFFLLKDPCLTRRRPKSNCLWHRPITIKSRA